MLGHLAACMPLGMERGLAWFPSVIFKGVINFKSSQDGRGWEGTMSTTRGPQEMLWPLTAGKYPSFCSRLKGKCLRTQTEPGH